MVGRPSPAASPPLPQFGEFGGPLLPGAFGADPAQHLLAHGRVAAAGDVFQKPGGRPEAPRRRGSGSSPAGSAPCRRGAPPGSPGPPPSQWPGPAAGGCRGWSRWRKGFKARAVKPGDGAFGKFLGRNARFPFGPSPCRTDKCEERGGYHEPPQAGTDVSAYGGVLKY
jgi:hypothetical protein